MARLGHRVGLLGRVRRAVPGGSITRMSTEQIARAQQGGIAHNRWSDAVFGAVASGTDLTDRVFRTGDGRDVGIRVYRPAALSGTAPLVLHFHGGGWTLGSLEGSDWVCSQVSAGVGAVVVSVDHRLAPTHRFPAAVEESYAALEWCAGHADELGADVSRTAVMGDSAGANLAALVCLLARDRSGPPIAQQSLVYPSTDLTLSGASIAANAHAPVLSAAELIAFRGHYLGADADAQRDPPASPPRAADHSGLPPALVQVAEHNPLRDDGVRYAEALRAAGVPVRLTEYAGMPHGYLSLPGVVREVGRPLAEVVGELAGALSTHPGAAPAAGDPDTSHRIDPGTTPDEELTR